MINLTEIFMAEIFEYFVVDLQKILKISALKNLPFARPARKSFLDQFINYLLILRKYQFRAGGTINST